jgi:hypothetical protein
MHNNKHPQRKNVKDYGCNTQYNDIQDNNVAVPNGSKMVLAVSFETSEYTFAYNESFGQQPL